MEKYKSNYIKKLFKKIDILDKMLKFYKKQLKMIKYEQKNKKCYLTIILLVNIIHLKKK